MDIHLYNIVAMFSPKCNLALFTFNNAPAKRVVVRERFCLQFVSREIELCAVGRRRNIHANLNAE